MESHPEEKEKESTNPKPQNPTPFQLSVDSNGKQVYTFNQFPQHPFIIDGEYILETIKGWGTYGVVAAGKEVVTGNAMAIKRISNVFDNLGDTKRILREIKILKFLKHRNIVGLKDMMSISEAGTFNEVYLCMEYMEYTLQRLIHSQQVDIRENMVQFILYQLLSAINFMHSADIIHRDLKPQNILINKKCELKIADMNLARKQTLSDQFTYYVTSRPYRAPEIFISNNAYTKAIDIWSVGCILAELLGKTVLFQGKDYIDQLRRFVAILGKPSIEIFPDVDPIAAQGLARVFKDIPDRQKVDWKFLFPNASTNALDLLDHMLVYDAKARFTAEECLNHPFLEEYKNRARTKCKEIFDFSFDRIEMTSENLRKAIYEEVESFQLKKSLKRAAQEDEEIKLIQKIQKKQKVEKEITKQSSST